VVVYRDKIRGACKVQLLTSPTQPHTSLHAPPPSLEVHVKVMLTPPCIFCIDNHYWRGPPAPPCAIKFRCTFTYLQLNFTAYR
jgi:hypothetical protein